MGFRFFNVYGPRQDPGSPYSGVISIFASNILSNRPIIIFGDGQQIRDFIFVSDIVAFLIRGMEKATTSSPVFNACTGVSTNIIQIAKSMGSIQRTVVKIEKQAARTGDIRVSLGNPNQALKNLGMKSSVPLCEGLRETLQFLKLTEIEAA